MENRINVRRNNLRRIPYMLVGSIAAISATRPIEFKKTKDTENKYAYPYTTYSLDNNGEVKVETEYYGELNSNSDEFLIEDDKFYEANFVINKDTAKDILLNRTGEAFKRVDEPDYKEESLRLDKHQTKVIVRDLNKEKILIEERKTVPSEEIDSKRRKNKLIKELAYIGVAAVLLKMTVFKKNKSTKKQLIKTRNN